MKARAAAEKAQEFAELAREHAEGAARELLTAKKAEIQAAALLEVRRHACAHICTSVCARVLASLFLCVCANMCTRVFAQGIMFVQCPGSMWTSTMRALGAMCPVHVEARVRACACVRACVCACVRGGRCARLGGELLQQRLRLAVWCSCLQLGLAHTSPSSRLRGFFAALMRSLACDSSHKLVHALPAIQARQQSKAVMGHGQLCTRLLHGRLCSLARPSRARPACPTRCALPLQRGSGERADQLHGGGSETKLQSVHARRRARRCVTAGGRGE